MSRISQQRKPSDQAAALAAQGRKTGVELEKEEKAAAAVDAAAIPSAPITPPPPPRFEITVPNGRFRGKRFGVPFVNGVGHTDNPILAERFRSMKYAVADRQAPIADSISPIVKGA